LSNTIKLLNVLDEYEEYDPTDEAKSLFVRKQVSVDMKGESFTSYAYVYNRPVDAETLISSGDYLKR
jgi:pyruvate carboxylase